jgi:hypothetical protein
MDIHPDHPTSSQQHSAQNPSEKSLNQMAPYSICPEGREQSSSLAFITMTMVEDRGLTIPGQATLNLGCFLFKIQVP